MSEVTVVTGAGLIGQAIARRVSVGKHVVLADSRGHDRRIGGEACGDTDEVGAVGALLMGRDGGFITGSDFLMDGGVTAAYWYGDLPEVRTTHQSA